MAILVSGGFCIFFHFDYNTAFQNLDIILWVLCILVYYYDRLWEHRNYYYVIIKSSRALLVIIITYYYAFWKDEQIL